MKKVILDYYRRWWLGLTAMILGHVLIEIYAYQAPVLDFSFTRTFSCQILGFLGFVLSGDLYRGAAKVFALLPLGKQQCGRALWIASVLVPGLALAGISLLVFVIANRSMDIMPWGKYFLHGGIIPLVCGATFGALTLKPSSAAPPLLARIQAVAMGLHFVIPLAGWYYLQNRTVNPFYSTLIILGLAILSVRGWLRAGNIIAGPMTLRPGNYAGLMSSGSPVSISGKGGLPFLVRRHLFRSVGMGLGLMLFVSLC